MAQNKPMLKVNNLKMSYGHSMALNGVSLEVQKGGIVVLAGANGAGKTSLMETVMGVYRPQSGEIYFKGKSIYGQPADKNVRRGMYLVPEGRGVFATMTVLDNLLIGAHYNTSNADDRLAFVFDAFPVLGRRRNQQAATLSGGERQMLAIARALMSSPEFILVDEPSLGLAPNMFKTILDILVMLNGEGYTIMLSEQNAMQSLKIAHRAYILEKGLVVKSGTGEELLADKQVCEAYLGVAENTSGGGPAENSAQGVANSAWECENKSESGALRGIESGDAGGGLSENSSNEDSQ